MNHAVYYLWCPKIDQKYEEPVCLSVVCLAGDQRRNGDSDMPNTTHQDPKKNMDEAKKSDARSGSDPKAQTNKAQQRSENKVRNPDERDDQDHSGGKRGQSR